MNKIASNAQKWPLPCTNKVQFLYYLLCNRFNLHIKHTAGQVTSERSSLVDNSRNHALYWPPRKELINEKKISSRGRLLVEGRDGRLSITANESVFLLNMDLWKAGGGGGVSLRENCPPPPPHIRITLASIVWSVSFWYLERNCVKLQLTIL